MAAPEHVPTKPMDTVRGYTSPPRRPDTWRADRPADFADDDRQPHGDRFGRQGPDQGYALRLASDVLAAEIVVQPGEHARDALAGIVAVAMKRASVFGRAPVIHDLRVAATIWGYLDATPDVALLERRRGLFEEVAHPHHYAELRHIVDLVSDEVLRMTPAAVADAHRADWRRLISDKPDPAHSTED